MTQPAPAPKNPRPIKVDPHAGQLQVVVSFRVSEPMPREHIENFVRDRLADIRDLDVAVRVIGAQSEKAEDEGRYDQLALTEDVERRGPWRNEHQIDTGGKT